MGECLGKSRFYARIVAIMAYKALSPIKIPDKYIKEIRYLGLDGRMLRLPAKLKKGKKTILYIHGQHAAIERNFSIAEYLQDFGDVYMPDLPGYGGMTPFFKIGLEPTYDAYADYIYTISKSNKLTKDLTIVANSYGAQLMTRMLQKYPDSYEWIDNAISLAGFGAGTDFHNSVIYKWSSLLAIIASKKPIIRVLDVLVLNKVSLKIMLSLFSRLKTKMQSDDENMSKEMIKMEAYLWTVNDSRTQATCGLDMFFNDLTKYSDKKIPLTLHNITTPNDQYFNNERVKNTFLKLYNEYKEYTVGLPLHNPSLIASKEEVAKLIPKGVQKLLSS